MILFTAIVPISAQTNQEASGSQTLPTAPTAQQAKARGDRRKAHEETWRAMCQKKHEADLAKWRPLLDEYHAGKLDDHDGSVVLYHMLTDYGLMRSTDTPEVAEMSKEYQALLKKHPEYVNMRFMRTHAQEAERKAARQAAARKYQALAQEKKAWTPKDDLAMSSYFYGSDVALVYQYRIEFYHLNPSDAEKAQAMMLSGGGFIKPSEIGRSISHEDSPHLFTLKESPHKIIAFQDAILVEPENWIVPLKSPLILVCTNPLLGYSARSDQERVVLGNDRIPWRNAKGEFHNFCGIINVNGTIVDEIPAEWDLPTFTMPLGILPDGKEALLGVGHWINVGPIDAKHPIVRPSDTGTVVFKYLIHWSYPGKIEKIDPESLSKQEADDLGNKFMTSVYGDVY